MSSGHFTCCISKTELTTFKQQVQAPVFIRQLNSCAGCVDSFSLKNLKRGMLPQKSEDGACILSSTFKLYAGLCSGFEACGFVCICGSYRTIKLTFDQHLLNLGVLQIAATLQLRALTPSQVGLSTQCCRRESMLTNQVLSTSLLKSHHLR